MHHLQIDRTTIRNLDIWYFYVVQTAVVILFILEVTDRDESQDQI